MAFEIRHDRSAQRFETHVNGAHCRLDYVLAGEVMTITHTDVPREAAGHGIAGELVRTALETARVEGWKVVPRCPYAATWMKRHPEYDDLRA